MVGSGNSDMSDSWMAWKPRIEEPSKSRPSSKTAWSNDDTGHGEVLHDAGQVAEADVDHLDALVLDVLEQLVAVLEHSSSLAAAGAQPAKSASEAPVRRCAGRACEPRQGQFLDRIRVCFGACNRCRSAGVGRAALPLTGRDRVPSPCETASWARRILALVVDWVASHPRGHRSCWAGGDYGPATSRAGFYVLRRLRRSSPPCFTALAGGSFGQLATRLRVVRVDGDRGRPDLLLRAGPRSC